MDETAGGSRDRDEQLVRRLAALAGAAPDEEGANALLRLAVGEVRRESAVTAPEGVEPEPAVTRLG